MAKSFCSLGNLYGPAVSLGKTNQVRVSLIIAITHLMMNTMKKLGYAFVLLLSICSQYAHAQSHDDGHWHRAGDDIQTLAGSMRHFGFYGGLSFRSTSLNDESLLMTGVRLGVIANRSLGIGIEGFGIIPTNSFSDVIAGRDVIALGGYGGLTIEPIFFSNRSIHITVPITGGAGWLGYHEDWRGEFSFNHEILAEDVFWYVEPGINAEINISRVLRLDVGIGKRFLQDFDLPNTPSSNFETINYTFGIKIGRF